MARQTFVLIMKIRLPKTLSEPLGIPWGAIGPYVDKEALAVHAALSAHMGWREKHGFIPGVNTLTTHEIIIRGLRAEVKRGGGRYPIGTHKETATGHLYTMAYQIIRGKKTRCYKYSIFFPRHGSS